ncbi:MAG TPA: hypothetical protein VGE24_05845, partial [Emticicia sp.]
MKIPSIKTYLLFFLGVCLNSCQNNEINVEAVGMESSKVKIVLLTIANQSGDIIYNHSEQQVEIPQEYGENEWLITYSDSLCTRFRHIKYNRNDKHSYHFRFFKTEGDIY